MSLTRFVCLDIDSLEFVWNLVVGAWNFDRRETPMTEKVATVAKLPRRPRDSHKGSFGHVLIIGGSLGMPGAVALAANAAGRGGAGLVTFAAPARVQQTIAGLAPCSTSIALPCGKKGAMVATAVKAAMDAAAKVDVLAVGPGLTIGHAQERLVQAAIGQNKPLVVDADGLNNLAAIKNWPRLRRCPMILTPHPGEFSRLTGRRVKDIQAAREDAAVGAARQWTGKEELVVVLKGAGTVVTDGRRVYVNDTGNPGMATGGTGDILTGLTAALLARGLSPFDAACLATKVHGRAGDLAAQEFGEPSLMAWDLLEYLPAAMKEAS